MQRPRPFILLAAATMLERIAWSAFRVGIVVFVAKTVHDVVPAPQWPSQVNALVSSAIYFAAPLVGLWITTQRRRRLSVRVGAALSGVGYGTMALFDSAHPEWLLAGGLLLVAGRCSTLPNLRSMLGDVFRAEHLDDQAFSQLYVFANIGSLTGILVSGAIRYAFDFRAVLVMCAVASTGCAICAQLIPDAKPSRSVRRPFSPPLSSRPAGRFPRFAAIAVLTIFASVFWAGFEQKTMALSEWAEMRHLARVTEWFQAFNPAFIILLYFPARAAFAWLGAESRRDEASPIQKLAFGLLMLACGFGVVAFAEGWQLGPGASAALLVLLYFMHTLGEWSLEPVGQALVAQLSPSGSETFGQALWDFASVIANLLAGASLIYLNRGGSFLTLWSVCAALPFAGGVLLLAIAAPLTRYIESLIEDASRVNHPTAAAS